MRNSSSELQLSKLVPKNADFLSLMRHVAATSMDLSILAVFAQMASLLLVILYLQVANRYEMTCTQIIYEAQNLKQYLSFMD